MTTIHRHNKSKTTMVGTAAERFGISKKLANAVVRQLGYDDLQTTLRDVTRGGADAGFGGFTYYKETCAFFKKNKGEILALLKQQASDMGTTVIEMVKGFRCARDVDASEDDIGEVLWGHGKRKSEVADQIENCLAWFALEEVARAVTEYLDEQGGEDDR